MRIGKYERKCSKKPIALLLSMVMLMSVLVNGTVAWLTDTTQSIENKFTASVIDIDLSESPNLDLKMIPGHTIKKDPEVTVKANSEKCYVFVELAKSTNFDTYMTYTVAEGWTELTENPGIYYRIVDSGTSDQSFDVLLNNKVAVKGDVSKAQMNALTEDTYPTLTITAYACQYMKNNNEAFTSGEAWEKAKPADSTT